MTRTVIIDGDVVIYKVAEAVADSFELSTEEDDEYIYRNIGWCNKEQANTTLENMIDRICKACKGDTVVICLSDMNGNFRKQINPDYKGNRKAVKPMLYTYLRQYLETSGYRIYEKPNLEADDVIGILATSDKIIKGDKVVWSLDKDFKTIPCKFHRAAITGKDKSEVITKEAADWWFMYQTLIGDKVDGYEGCKGIGDKTARKILGEIGENPIYVMWQSVIDAYKSKGYTEEDALRNARMARILRAEDYDFKKKEVKLWEI
jgi:DNA polymerase-1